MIEETAEVCREMVATPEQAADLCADLGQHIEASVLTRFPQGGP